MAPIRTILHADMDAFYAAIEQRDRPELRGKPVIVGGSERRSVVATASYEARKFGVHSAMPGVRAKQLCPHGIFVRPRMQVYVAVGEQIRGVFERFTDLVEPLSLDEAFLDVTGSRALFGDGAAIARQLKQAVWQATQLRVSVGVASSKYVAKVASDLQKPDGLVVVEPGREREFLAPLPVRRLWGAGPKTQELLQRAGLRTIGELQSRSLQQLTAAFGAHQAEHFHALAHGLDARPVEPSREAKSIGHEMTFDKDLTTREQCHALLLQLSEMVGRRLRQAAVTAGCVRLKARYPDFTTFSRQRHVEATQDERVLYATAKALFDELWPGRPGIRLLGVTAAGIAAAATSRQGVLFAEAPAKSGRLLAALDAIKDRFGEDAIHHGMERKETTPWGPIGQSGGNDPVP